MRRPVHDAAGEGFRPFLGRRNSCKLLYFFEYMLGAGFLPKVSISLISGCQKGLWRRLWIFLLVVEQQQEQEKVN